MILTNKTAPKNFYYKLFFKVPSASSKTITKNLCKEITQKCLSFKEEQSEETRGFNSSYTDQIISFAVTDKELATKIQRSLTNNYFSTELFPKSVNFNGSKIKQYIITSQLTSPILFKEYLLKKVARDIYEKFGYISQIDNGFITIRAENLEQIARIEENLAQGGRVSIRMQGNKKMINEKREEIKVGKVLFSNWQGRPLFDSCIEKDKNVFIVLNAQVLYELRMMLRVGELSNATLYLECDDVIYSSFIVNEQNLLRPEILLATFKDQLSAQKFVKKLSKPLQKIYLKYTEFTEKRENEKIWILLNMLFIALFLYFSKRRKRTALFTLSGLISSCLIYQNTVGILHLKILSICLLFNILILNYVNKINYLLSSMFIIFISIFIRHFLKFNLPVSLFLSSLSQLFSYQNISVFLYNSYRKSK